MTVGACERVDVLCVRAHARVRLRVCVECVCVCVRARVCVYEVRFVIAFLLSECSGDVRGDETVGLHDAGDTSPSLTSSLCC